MRIKGLHHIAYKCGDPEATRRFYEDVLGLPMTMTVEANTVPSTGGPAVTYFHFFFEMADGSSIAFFDFADDQAPLPSPNVPAWANHLALQVDTLEELRDWHRRLTEAGIDVAGELDHEFVRSIYFFDPNGVRLELTAKTESEPAYVAKAKRAAHEEFSRWLVRRQELKSQSAVS